MNFPLRVDFPLVVAEDCVIISVDSAWPPAAGT